MSKSLELKRLCIYSLCSKLEKKISPSAESALITKTEENNRKDENIMVLAKETTHMMQRGVPTACSNCEYCVWIWSLYTVRLRGGETRLAGFFRQVHRHQAYHKQVNNWIKVNVIRSLHFPGKLGGILVLTLFMGLLPLRTQECR